MFWLPPLPVNIQHESTVLQDAAFWLKLKWVKVLLLFLRLEPSATGVGSVCTCSILCGYGIRVAMVRGFPSGTHYSHTHVLSTKGCGARPYNCIRCTTLDFGLIADRLLLYLYYLITCTKPQQLVVQLVYVYYHGFLVIASCNSGTVQKAEHISPPISL